MIPGTCSMKASWKKSILFLPKQCVKYRKVIEKRTSSSNRVSILCLRISYAVLLQDPCVRRLCRAPVKSTCKAALSTYRARERSMSQDPQKFASCHNRSDPTRGLRKPSQNAHAKARVIWAIQNTKRVAPRALTTCRKLRGLQGRNEYRHRTMDATRAQQEGCRALPKRVSRWRSLQRQRVSPKSSGR